MTTPRFTDRQRQVIQLIAEGCSNEEIADRLGVTARTAKAHCDSLRTKLGVTRRRYIPLAYRSIDRRRPHEPGSRLRASPRSPARVR